MPRAPLIGRTHEPVHEHESAQPERGDPRPFLDLVERLRPKVEARLEQVLRRELRDARRRGSPLVAMVETLSDLTMRGGKRLRAALVLVGYRAVAPRGSLAPVVETCVALELLQSYLLIHDDWMDRDRVRRGGPAAHVALERRLGSEHAGAASAILAGDFASALSTRLLAAVKVSPQRLVRLVRYFAQMELDVVSGQQLDMVPGAHGVEDVYALKTASYSVGGPLGLGVLVGGGGERELRALDRIAAPLGIAFQHRDDLLGTFGNRSVTGKPLGSDIRQGKRTALTELATRRLRGRSRAIFKSAFANPSATERQVGAALAVLEASGYRELVEARVDELVSEARAAIASARVPVRTKALLESAIATLVDRRS